MPKGSKQKKRNDHTNTKNSLSLPRMDLNAVSDEDSLNDNASVISTVSSGTIYDDANIGDDVTDQNELFEDKLAEAIEGMSEKSAQSRVNSFESVAAALMKKFIPDFVNQRRLTLCDAIERSLKKGRTDERAAAAQLAALLCIQLGSTDTVDELCKCLIPSLLLIVNDHGTSPVVRSKCCWALSLLTFIGNYDDVQIVMDSLKQIFCESSSLAPSQSAEDAALYSTALSAWCLLLTVTSNASLLLSALNDVICLLDANSVEIRMAAGEMIAVVLEQLKEYDNSDEWEPDDDLILKLKELATDSHKFRAKKDRKTQRSVFRDIIRYVEDGEFPKLQVRFGQECLSLDTWCRKKQYDAFRQALGSGLNLHLKDNDLLREILNLGEKIASLPSPLQKQSKLERHLLNAAACKARNICRAKYRDKRTISIS